MSNYLYLVCNDHDPVIDSYWIGEVGQHLNDIVQVRKDIARRDKLVELYQEDDITFDNTWTRTAAMFFTQHPKCRITIRDETGTVYPAVEPEGPKTPCHSFKHPHPKGCRCIRLCVICGFSEAEHVKTQQ